MNKKPIIGIAGNTLSIPDHPFGEYWRSYVNEDYVISVLRAGGVPYILPIIDDKEVIQAQLENVDGLIISGGDNDINPKLYGQKLEKETVSPNDKRDFFDFHLAALAKKMKKPSLFICRGHQVATIENGGTLYQDVSYAPNITIKHHNNPSPDYPAHMVDIDKDSFLFDILQKDKVWVNSFHHQLVKDVPQGYKVTALAPDGCIEAIEPIKRDCFYLSLQWHPEMMAAKGNEDMKKIFTRLIEEANKLKELL